MMIQIITKNDRDFILSFKDFKPGKNLNVQIADYIAIKINEEEVKKIEIRKY